MCSVMRAPAVQRRAAAQLHLHQPPTGVRLNATSSATAEASRAGRSQIQAHM